MSSLSLDRAHGLSANEVALSTKEHHQQRNHADHRSEGELGHVKLHVKAGRHGRIEQWSGADECLDSSLHGLVVRVGRDQRKREEEVRPIGHKRKESDECHRLLRNG